MPNWPFQTYQIREDGETNARHAAPPPAAVAIDNATNRADIEISTMYRS